MTPTTFVFLLATFCAGGDGHMGTVCEKVVIASSEFDPYLNMVSCSINGQQLAIAFRTASVKFHDYAISNYSCVRGERRNVT